MCRPYNFVFFPHKIHCSKVVCFAMGSLQHFAQPGWNDGVFQMTGLLVCALAIAMNLIKLRNTFNYPQNNRINLWLRNLISNVTQFTIKSENYNVYKIFFKCSFFNSLWNNFFTIIRNFFRQQWYSVWQYTILHFFGWLYR